ncbi:MAG: phosphotransferase [Ichthyobacteriaceae bacterium]|nr:phosphotransferase [Ichthyobacteriaceae bacterium]
MNEALNTLIEEEINAISDDMFTDKERLLKELFENQFKTSPFSIEKLPQSGSNREYYRLSDGIQSAIGVYNDDYKENLAFIEYSKHFRNKGLNVPEIFCDNLQYHIYLQEDLGNETFFSLIERHRGEDNYNAFLYNHLKKVIEKLPEFQTKAHSGLDYSFAYPRESFDRQSMQWDLSYFKYYFLKLANVPFNEQDLENDFATLIDYLCATDSDYFLFRDFQSRNIMFNKESEPWFIDYQGGRKGALQYDLASMLYDGKADIPQEMREEMIEIYIQSAKNYIDIDSIKFKNEFYPFVLIRIMQAMGAYGYRGFYEKKAHFLKSIPYALKNMKWILDNVTLDLDIPHLKKALRSITESEQLLNINNPETLNVTITSFSYKKGLPQDTSGNGGGFVFDCRWIHNPGRYEPYKQLTGRDQPVIDFLDKEEDMKIHLDSVYTVVDKAIERYINREFTSLMINFGCTGGRHRSVYSAEHLAKHLKERFNIKINIHHIEQNIMVEDYNID